MTDTLAPFELELQALGVDLNCRAATQELYDHNYADGYGCRIFFADKSVCQCRCHSEKDFDCTEPLSVLVDDDGR